MNISKEDFVETINKLQECWDRENKIHDALEVCDIYFEDNSADYLYSTTIHLLELLTNDPANDIYGSDISYFCWELNFGREYKPGMITDNEGKDIDFSSAEKLYDYLAGREK